MQNFSIVGYITKHKWAKWFDKRAKILKLVQKPKSNSGVSEVKRKKQNKTGKEKFI